MTELDNIAHEISLVDDVLHIKITDSQENETYVCDIINDELAHHKLISTTSILRDMMSDGFEKHNNDAVSITYCKGDITDNTHSIILIANLPYISDKIIISLDKVDKYMLPKQIIDMVDDKIEQKEKNPYFSIQ